MKKKVIISFVALAIIASASTAYALNSQTTPVKVQNTAHIAKNDSAAQTATQPSTDTTPVAQQQEITQSADTTTPVQEPTADETKTEVYQKVADFALSKGAATDFTSTNVYYIQTHCIDQMLAANNISYTDHDEVISFLNDHYFSGTANADGTTTYMHFDDSSCHVSQISM